MVFELIVIYSKSTQILLNKFPIEDENYVIMNRNFIGDDKHK